MQYAEDTSRSWNARASAKTWRSEIDDIRENGPVHIVSEAICADQSYSVTVTGAKSSQKILIGGTLYKREGQANWEKSPPGSASAQTGIPFCQDTPQPVDAARVRLVAEELRDITLSKPVMREIAGRQCREWTRTFMNGKIELLSTNCFDVKTHELVQSKLGNMVSTYYWNVPVEIKPPM